MFVIFLQIKEKYFDVTFGTEENSIWPKLSVNYVVFFEVYGQIQQAVHHKAELSLCELVFFYLFLIYGLLKSKIVVVAVCMNFGILDTHMIFYVKIGIHFFV